MTYLTSTNFFRAGLLLTVAFVMSLAMTAQAEAECMTPHDCFISAEWRQAAADDFYNQGVWFQGASRTDFVNAKQWGDKATFAFHAGDGPAAALFKTAADEYSRRGIANAKAADQRFAQAQFTHAAAANDVQRGMFIMAARASNGCSLESLDSDGVVACAARRSSCQTQRHPRDPSWATVCERHFIAVCDANRDGHKTYVDYYPMWSTQDEPSMTQYDSYGRSTNRNGVKQFCWHERPSDTAGLGIQRFRVCVQYEGCSSWRYY